MVFDSGKGKGVHNIQIILSGISTIMPWAIPFPVMDFNGGFLDSVLFLVSL